MTQRDESDSPLELDLDVEVVTFVGRVLRIDPHRAAVLVSSLTAALDERLPEHRRAQHRAVIDAALRDDSATAIGILSAAIAGYTQ